MSTFAFIVYDVIYKIINKTYTTEVFQKKKKKEFIILENRLII